MRTEGKLNLFVLIVVMCSLSVCGLAVWQDSGVGVGVRLLLAALMTAGVIWLSLNWLKLVGEITSIVSCFGQKQSARKNPKSLSDWLGLAGVDGISQVVNEKLNNNDGLTGKLKEQIRDLQIQIQLSQRQKNNTEAIIYSINDAVLVIDELDRVLMANGEAGKIFGFDFRNSRYKSIDDLISDNNSEHKEFVNFLRQSRQNKASHTRREIEFLIEDRMRSFDCIISCVYDSKEQISAVAAVLHDVTREKEISQMKNDFVSHVSHELKTPLASITAYSEMLVDGEADNEQTKKEFYGVIQSQAKRLNALIEDILNVSRIESGLIKVKKEPVSLTILIEEQLQMIKGFAEEKDIEVVGQNPIVFDQVYADKDMLQQVIVNLLSNAVKYTPAGGKVNIETEVDAIENLVRVSVIDTGVGIAEDEVEHVFDKFYRVEANKAQAKGTGLGLNLVKQIVEKVHSGKVFVKSQRGVGSTFGFELPLAGTNSEKVKSEMVRR